jgi:hypothetical protein
MVEVYRLALKGEESDRDAGQSHPEIAATLSDRSSSNFELFR